jgi:hypothetical protein
MTILLRDLISEAGNTGPENRVTVMKIASILEKVLPELTKKQAEKLTELFEEISLMATHLNSAQYTVKENDLYNWESVLSEANETVDKMRTEVEKLAESKKNVDFRPLILALDEVLKI